MQAIPFVLACLAYIAQGRRIQDKFYAELKTSDEAGDTVLPSQLGGSREALRHLFVAAEPGAGWQMSGAVHGHGPTADLAQSFAACSNLQQGQSTTRCPSPVLVGRKGYKNVFKPRFPKAGSVAEGKDLKKKMKNMKGKRFEGGSVEEALQYAQMEAKYGKARYLAPDDPRRLEVDPMGYYETKRARERFELKGQANEEYGLYQGQLLQDHAFLTLLSSALVWSLFNLRTFASYLVGAAGGLFFLYLLGKQAAGIGAETEEQANRLPPPVVAPLLAMAITIKQKEYLDVVPAIIGLSSYLVSVVYQIVYPDGYGMTLGDEEEEPPTIAET